MSNNRPPREKKRPNSYAAQACERCRRRRQRCVPDEVSSEGSSRGIGQVCRNCATSGSSCVYASPSGSSKDGAERGRRASHSTSSDGNEGGSTYNDPHLANANDHYEPGPTSRGGQDLHSKETSTSPGTKAGHYGHGYRQPQIQAGVPWSSTRSEEISQSGGVNPSSAYRADAGLDWSPGVNASLRGVNDQTASMSSTGRQSTSIPHVASSTAQSSFAIPSAPPPLNRHTSSHPPNSSTTTSYQNTNHQSHAQVQPTGVATKESTPDARFDTATGIALVSLEAAAEPHYIGESSGFMWSTVFSKGLSADVTDFEGHARPSPTNKKPPSAPVEHHALLSNLQQAIPDKVAERVLEAVYVHLHPRYPFMDWLRFDEQWRAREGLLLAIALSRPLNKEAAVAAFFVLMVLAIGAQLCRNERLAGLLQAEEYYALACPLLPYIVQLHNLANIQGLLLLAMYSLRDSRGPSIWYMSGVTMRLCCGLGLHRSPGSRVLGSTSPYDVRMRKRVFWTCYTLDRMMSITLGRPPGISDDDIDVELPDLVIDDLSISLPSMQTQHVESAVHYIKLKRIESRIQRSIYAVANRGGKSNVEKTWEILKMIDEWEQDIPAQASSPDYRKTPSCSKDWFVLRGAEARLHLLRPICTDLRDDVKPFIPLLAQNAARGCELQKRTHHLGQPSSSTSAHSTFICGLALLYAIFLQPEAIPLRQVFGAISAASSTLFAYAQSDTTLAALHDVFEELSSTFIDRMSSGTGTGSGAGVGATSIGTGMGGMSGTDGRNGTNGTIGGTDAVESNSGKFGNHRGVPIAGQRASAGSTSPSERRPLQGQGQGQGQGQEQSRGIRAEGAITSQTLSVGLPMGERDESAYGMGFGTGGNGAGNSTGNGSGGGSGSGMGVGDMMGMNMIMGMGAGNGNGFGVGAHTPGQAVADGWQRTFEQATNNMEPTVVNEYMDLLQSLGLQMPDTDMGQDSLWDLAVFTNNMNGDGMERE